MVETILSQLAERRHAPSSHSEILPEISLELLMVKKLFAPYPHRALDEEVWIEL